MGYLLYINSGMVGVGLCSWHVRTWYYHALVLGLTWAVGVSEHIQDAYTERSVMHKLMIPHNYFLT